MHLFQKRSESLVVDQDPSACLELRLTGSFNFLPAVLAVCNATLYSSVLCPLSVSALFDKPHTTTSHLEGHCNANTIEFIFSLH